MYHRGWNLVPAPAGTRFGAASGPLYTLQLGEAGHETLQPDDAVKPRLGYWAYFAADTSVSLAGGGPQRYPVPVPPGQWVLLGDPSGSSDVTVTGAGLVYTHDPIAGQCQRVTTLHPGQGAFVFSGSGATVTLQQPFRFGGAAATITAHRCRQLCAMERHVRMPLHNFDDPQSTDGRDGLP